MIDVHALPRNAKVLQEIAQAWINDKREAGRDICEGTIFVPSRRAARALSSEFLRASDRAAVVLPRIVPLNAIDEIAVFFSAGLQLPPAMSDVRRVAILSALILKWNGRAGAPETVGGAMRLARDLAQLMDEAARWEVDLKQVLPGIVEGDLAAHWRDTVEFLSIVTSVFPAILVEEGAVTKEARRLMLMEAQIANWRDAPPSEPVWLVGVAYATPPLARFVKAVSCLPHGRVFLTAYDTLMFAVSSCRRENSLLPFASFFSTAATGKGRKHDHETTVDHALIRGLVTAGPMMRRGASSV